MINLLTSKSLSVWLFPKGSEILRPIKRVLMLKTIETGHRFYATLTCFAWWPKCKVYLNEQMFSRICNSAVTSNIINSTDTDNIIMCVHGICSCVLYRSEVLIVICNYSHSLNLIVIPLMVFTNKLFSAVSVLRSTFTKTKSSGRKKKELYKQGLLPDLFPQSSILKELWEVPDFPYKETAVRRCL